MRRIGTMRNKLATGMAFVCAVVFAMSVAQFAGGRVTHKVTSDGAGDTWSTGMSATALSTSPTTTHLPGDSAQANQLVLYTTIAAGTTTSLTVACSSSPDESNWYPFPDAISSGSGGYDVYSRTDTYTVTSGTTTNLPPLWYPVHGQSFRCQYTGAGTGTITSLMTVGDI